MSDCIVRIEKLTNGFEVELRDPKIDAENAKPKSSWKDPWKGYAFKTAAEVAEFLTAVLDKLTTGDDKDEFAAAFSAATEEEQDD